MISFINKRGAGGKNYETDGKHDKSELPDKSISFNSKSTFNIQLQLH